jgi:hypothetical protein
MMSAFSTAKRNGKSMGPATASSVFGVFHEKLIIIFEADTHSLIPWKWYRPPVAMLILSGYHFWHQI